jgi:hypothetical protein
MSCANSKSMKKYITEEARRMASMINHLENLLSLIQPLYPSP